MSEKDLDEVFPILMVLEGLAGRMACIAMSDAAIAEVEALQERMVAEYSRGDLRAYFQTNQLIHEAILVGSGNEALMSTHRSLAGRVRRARYLANMSKERWRQAVDEHAAILSALRARDGARIEALLQAHLSNKLETIRASLRENV